MIDHYHLYQYYSWFIKIQNKYLSTDMKPKRNNHIHEFQCQKSRGVHRPPSQQLWKTDHRLPEAVWGEKVTISRHSHAENQVKAEASRAEERLLEQKTHYQSIIEDQKRRIGEFEDQVKNLQGEENSLHRKEIRKYV